MVGKNRQLLNLLLKRIHEKYYYYNYIFIIIWFFMLNHKTNKTKKIAAKLQKHIHTNKSIQDTHAQTQYVCRLWDHTKHRKYTLLTMEENTLLYCVLYYFFSLSFALDTIPISRIVLMFLFPLNTIQAGYSCVFLCDPTHKHTHTISIDGPICTTLDVKAPWTESTTLFHCIHAENDLPWAMNADPCVPSLI